MTKTVVPAGEQGPIGDARIAAILAVVVLCAGLLALNSNPLGVVHDDAVYAILAKGIATGQGYRYLNLPGQPFATHFPPGYPAFLAILWRIAPSFPANVLLFKCANAVVLALACVAMGLLLRQDPRLSRTFAWVVAALAATSVPILIVSSLVLSETLFLLVAALALVAGQRALRGDATWRDAVLCGVLCGAATLVRSPGIALFAACVLCLLAQRSFRNAGIVAGIGVLSVVPWQLWTTLHGNDVPSALQGAYGPYGAWLSEAIRTDGISFLAQTVQRTSEQAVAVVINAVSLTESTPARLVAAACLLPLLVLGVRETWKQSALIPIFLACYLALVLIWPAPPVRYIWGIWPVLFIVLAIGMHAIFAKAWTTRRSAVWTGVLVASVIPALGYAKYTAIGYRDRAWLRMPQQTSVILYPLVTGIRNRVAPNSVVASSAEAAVYLYTGRPTVPTYSFSATEFLHGPDTTAQVRAMSEIAQTYPVDVFVGSTPLQRYVVRQLRLKGDSSFQLVDSIPGSSIYIRRPAPATAGEESTPR